MLLGSGVPTMLYGVVDADGMVILEGEGAKPLPDCRDTERGLVGVVTCVVSSVTDML